MGAYNGIDESNLTGASLEGGLRNLNELAGYLDPFTSEGKARKKMQQKKDEANLLALNESIQQSKALDQAQSYLQRVAEQKTVRDSGDFTRFNIVEKPTDANVLRKIDGITTQDNMNQALNAESINRKNIAVTEDASLRLTSKTVQTVLNAVNKYSGSPSAQMAIIADALDGNSGNVSGKDKDILLAKLGRIEAGAQSEDLRNKEAILSRQERIDAVQENKQKKAEGDVARVKIASQHFYEQAGVLDEEGFKDLPEGNPYKFYHKTFQSFSKNAEMSDDDIQAFHSISSSYEVLKDLALKGFHVDKNGMRHDGVLDSSEYLKRLQQVQAINGKLADASKSGNRSALMQASAEIEYLLLDDVSAKAEQIHTNTVKQKTAEKHSMMLNSFNREHKTNFNSGDVNVVQLTNAVGAGIDVRFLPNSAQQRNAVLDVVYKITEDSDKFFFDKVSKAIKEDDMSSIKEWFKSQYGVEKVPLNLKKVLNKALEYRTATDVSEGADNAIKSQRVIKTREKLGVMSKADSNMNEVLGMTGDVKLMINPNSTGKGNSHTPYIDIGEGFGFSMYNGILAQVELDANGRPIIDEHTKAPRASLIKYSQLSPEVMSRITGIDAYSVGKEFDDFKNSMLTSKVRTDAGMFSSFMAEKRVELDAHISYILSKNKLTAQEYNGVKTAIALLKTVPDAESVLTYRDKLNAELGNKLGNRFSGGKFDDVKNFLADLKDRAIIGSKKLVDSNRNKSLSVQAASKIPFFGKEIAEFVEAINPTTAAGYQADRALRPEMSDGAKLHTLQIYDLARKIISMSYLGGNRTTVKNDLGNIDLSSPVTPYDLDNFLALKDAGMARKAAAQQTTKAQRVQADRLKSAGLGILPTEGE